jgi:glycosyltransferase involved in cell wall biosynthesis
MANDSSDYPTIHSEDLAPVDEDRQVETNARVMLDARYVGDKVTGIGRYTYNIVRELLRLDPTLELILLTDPARPRLVESPRVESRPTDVDPYSPVTRFLLSRFVDFGGVDLYHSPFNFQPARIPVPTVLTLHDIMWLADASYVASDWLERIFSAPYLQWCTKHSVREADRVLTVSDHSRTAIESWFPLKAGRVDVTYNAADESFRPVDPEEGWSLIEEYVPRDATFVFSLGTQSPYKNHEGALEAFIEAFGDREDAYFVLVQRRTYRAEGRLGELLRHPEVGDRILRLDYVSDAELRALYSMARVLLFPSLYEGFGLPILEAMQCGTPVITSDRGAPAEVAGEAGVCVDPESTAEMAGALERLFDDDAFYEERREAGFERAAEFTWERAARVTLESYKSVLGRDA